MMRLVIVVALIAATTACTPARMVGNAAITGGQVVLGAADMVI